MHILYLEDDIKLLQKFESIAKILGIQFTIVSSLKEAKQAMKEHDFYAYMLSSKYPVEELKIKKDTILTYDRLPEVNQLKELKKNQKVLLVTGKPMSSEELHYVIEKLCHLSNQIDPLCDWIREIPEPLMNNYVQLTYERLAVIYDLIQEAKIAPSAQMWEKLQNCIHKIAGSAGMYGRTKASEICKKLEIQLKNKDYSKLNLDSFYRQLYLYIQ